MKRWHILKILKRESNIGDPVILYNSRMRSFLDKLKSKYSRPFKVSEVIANSVIEVEKHKGRSSN